MKKARRPLINRQMDAPCVCVCVSERPRKGPRLICFDLARVRALNL